MFVAYAVVTILAAAATFGATAFDIVKAGQVRETMRGYGLPQWTLNPLAVLKALGGLGLLIGLAIPPLGRTAALCLVLYFLGAEITIIRAKRYTDIAYPLPYLILSAASLALFAYA
ncbi:DoxX family protein [Nocardia vinacea]|uniref:DoxX family protein n=1 Tax=Nocardia vinacea TaxID=96468 RepID=UPI0002EFD030|nr:DoxX family protein [Nocardia vinacea]